MSKDNICVILDFSDSKVIKTTIPRDLDSTEKVEEYLQKQGYKLSQIQFMYGDTINFEGF